MDFLFVLQNGSYYYPATKRYNSDEIIVTCDRCRRTDILSCLGYKNIDLCMTCVNELEKLYVSKTKIIQNGGYSNSENEINTIKTKMLQFQFNEKSNDDYPIRTKMIQFQFNDNSNDDSEDLNKIMRFIMNN